jgi:hypothetical protein
MIAAKMTGSANMVSASAQFCLSLLQSLALATFSLWLGLTWLGEPLPATLLEGAGDEPRLAEYFSGVGGTGGSISSTA